MGQSVATHGGCVLAVRGGAPGEQMNGLLQACEQVGQSVFTLSGNALAHIYRAIICLRSLRASGQADIAPVSDHRDLPRESNASDQQERIAFF
jgi:hypothetical protein